MENFVLVVNTPSLVVYYCTYIDQKVVSEKLKNLYYGRYFHSLGS